MKPDGISWDRFVDGHCRLKRSRADKLIEVADGRITVADLREQTRLRVQRHRDRTSVLRNTGPHPRRHPSAASTDPDPTFAYYTDAKDRLFILMNGRKLTRWSDQVNAWKFLGDPPAECVIEETVRLGDTCYPIENEPEPAADDRDAAGDEP